MTSRNPLLDILRAHSAGKQPIVAHERCKHCGRIVQSSPGGVWVDFLDYDVCDPATGQKHESENES